MLRNMIDQDDEQTKGADKQSLLNGERATTPPPPGTLKSEQPAPAPQPVRRAPRPQRVAQAEPAAEAPKPQPTPPPRPNVEMIQGTKRSTVEFP
jgi:hypothetical protein